MEATNMNIRFSGLRPGLFFRAPSYSGCARLFLVLTALSFAGCSSNDDNGDDFFNSARVVDLAVEDSTIHVGDGTVLAVNFSFDASNVFNDDDNVSVVVRLPEGIEYRDDTSEIDGVSGDDGVGAQVVRCVASGETYLIYDLDRFDLDNAANPAGDGDAVITLTIDATKRGDFATIEAAADGDRTPLFSCGSSFASDEQVSIEVD